MNTKILFLDLDGTLLNDAREITPGNRAALESALGRGHRVVITTGRPLASALIQAGRLHLTGPGCYLIAFNGSIIYDLHRDQVIFSGTLPIPTALAVIRLGDSMGIHMQTYDDRKVLLEPRWEDEFLRQYCQRILMDYQIVEDLDAGLVHRPAKVLAMGRDQQALLPLKLAVEQQFGVETDCFFSGRQLLEIVPKGMNKGAAIRQTCRILGIPMENAIAVGDEENDLTMIQAAGVGVAMANGTQRVRAAADYVTRRDNNHDGIAEVVAQFLSPD